MRRVIVFTGTRADWGILSGVCRALDTRGDVELAVAATNMHLSERFGHTIDEITADGFDPVVIPMDADADTAPDRIAAMADCMAGTGRVLAVERPDMAVILGDRFEMLAVATACVMSGVPIAHIAGGEISEGAIDDSMRHAITKLSALHLTATEAYRRRVIAMGEEPSRVINTGALGVYNLRSLVPVPLEELESFCHMKLDRDTLLVTYHPATLDTGGIDGRVHELLGALDSLSGTRALITYPNNDARGRRVIELLEDYAASRAATVSLVPSLGRRRYHSVLRYVGVVVGNSSSGIVEVPSAGIPTVDIGIRQRGRIAGPSVIHCGDSKKEILQAIRRALSPEMRAIAASGENPYGRPDTLDLIVSAIAETPLDTLRVKHFHDINPL